MIDWSIARLPAGHVCPCNISAANQCNVTSLERILALFALVNQFKSMQTLQTNPPRMLINNRCEELAGRAGLSHEVLDAQEGCPGAAARPPSSFSRRANAGV